MIKNFFIYHRIHKSIVPIFDKFFIVRPTLFFSIWVMLVCGMICAKTNSGNGSLWIFNFEIRTLFLFAGITFLCASSFITNQITDIHSDKLNKKLKIVESLLSIEFCNNLSKNCFLVALSCYLLLLLYDSVYFNSNFIFIDVMIFIFSMISYFVWSILYNKEPYLFRAKPIMGLLSNSLVGLLLFSIGYIFIDINFNDLLFFCIPYVLAFSSVSILCCIPDMKGDVDSEYKTFPIFFGKKISILVACFCIFTSLIISINNKDPLSSTAILVSCPFFLFALFRTYDKDIIRAIRYPVMILNFFSWTFYPVLFLVSLVLFYFSKYYYWHRFNLHYPTFLIDD